MLNSKNRFRLLPGLFLLALLFFQFLTGLLLSLYHTPSTEGAFKSLFFLRTQVFLGNTIHSLHYWGARLLVIFAFIHGLLLLVERGYQRSKLQWVFGAIILFLILNEDLSGRLLPYSQRGFWEATRSMEALKFIPLWGDFLLHFTQAKEGLFDLSYIRFYVFHISWVPGLLVIFLILHMRTTLKEGYRTGGRIELLKPSFLMRVGEFLLVVLALLATLGVLFPPKHGVPADTLHPFEGANAVWYLRPFHFLAQYLPPLLAGTILAVLLLSLFFIPWVEKEVGKLARLWGVFVAVLYFILAILG